MTDETPGSQLNPPPNPSQHPIVDFSDEDLAALLRRAVVLTAALGLGVALLLLLGMGWRTAVLFAVGAAISVASIFEWGRLIRLFNAQMDRKKTPRGASLVVVFFLLRLMIFAGVIYGSLKCFQGSPIALLCGLSLSVISLVWEALRVLRG